MRKLPKSYKQELRCSKCGKRVNVVTLILENPFDNRSKVLSELCNDCVGNKT